MKSVKADGSREKLVLTAFITRKAFLSKIAPHWKVSGLFKSRWANIVGDWCVSYYIKYKKSPGKNIVALFESWSEGPQDGKPKPDSETVSLVETFLKGISEEHSKTKDKPNLQHLIDTAAIYFEEVRILNLAEKLRNSILNGEVKKAQRAISKSRGIELASNSIISFFKDDIRKEIFTKAEEPLFKFEGPAGKMFGDMFIRDSFCCFMGKTKVGKSFWLARILLEALKNGKRALYISTGDSSRLQVGMRLSSLFLQWPMKATKIRIPVSLHYDGLENGYAKVDKEYRKFKHKLTWQIAEPKYKELIKTGLNGNADILRMGVYPSNSLTALGIDALVEEEFNKGFPADIILIDYMDLLAKPPGIADLRESIDESWKTIRSLGQKMNVCVVSLTQADTAAMDTYLLRRKNFTDSRKKLDHVTAMWGINQHGEEQGQQLYRINAIAKREEMYDEELCLHTAACLAICEPMMIATF